MSCAISGTRARRYSPNGPSASARSCGDMRGQGPSSKAARAARTARSISAGVDEGAVPIRSSVTGEMTSITSCEAGVTMSPPMNSRSCTVRLVMTAPLAAPPPVSEAEPSPRDVCLQPTTAQPRPPAGFHQTKDQCRGDPRPATRRTYAVRALAAQRHDLLPSCRHMSTLVTIERPSTARGRPGRALVGEHRIRSSIRARSDCGRRLLRRPDRVTDVSPRRFCSGGRARR